MSKADGGSGLPQDALPRSDPAFPIVSEILAVVPASRWTFARIEPNGEVVSAFGFSAQRVEGLTAEFKRQRTKPGSGAKISATMGDLEEFASGITLLFADARTNYGILTLLRTRELGPFTSSEISVLTLALDAVSDKLSGFRLQPPRPADTDAVDRGAPPAPEQHDGAFYVLDSDLQIVLAWSEEEQRRIALTGLYTRISERLPVLLENTVRELTAAWSGQSVKEKGVANPVPFLVVRTQPMSGPIGLFIGVHVDRFRPSNSLIGAAARYHISPREVQVLALLLDGERLEDVAARLSITSSTVQDHINSMLEKTESRNRTELVARVLGWDATPSAGTP